MKRFFIALTLLLNTYSSYVFLLANTPKLGIPDVEYFNRRQYGGATQNWKVSQGKSDLLYFANNDGLLEYDGVRWRLHRHMGDLIVRSATCIDDKVYAGGFNEFGFFRYDSLHHFQYTSLATTPELKSLGNTWAIHELENKVIFQFDVAICVFEDDKLVATIPSNSRFISSFIANGLLLVQDESRGLLEVRGNKAFPIAGGDIFTAKTIASVMELSENRIAIGTMRAGMYIWDMQTIEPWDIPANEELKKANVFCGVSYQDEYLVFGTIQNGFLITDMNGKLVMQIDKDKGLVNNTVLSVFVDREGGIWGGLDNGIARISLNSSVSFLGSYYNLGTGYIMRQYRNSYYFGTNQALYAIDKERFKDPLKDRRDFQRIKGTEGQVWSLYQDDTGLLCGHNLGIFAISGRTSKLITPPDVKGVWGFIEIKDRPDLMLAGTYNGLILLKKEEKSWRFVKHISGFEESSRFAEWDNERNLWVAHGSKGLYQIRLSKDYQVIEDVKSHGFTLFDDKSSMVISKVKGQCIVAGNNGIYQINENGSATPYTLFDTYFINGDFPSQLYEDRFRNVWYFQANKVGVLRYLEDGSYKRIDYPFLSLEQKLVSGFESVFVVDKQNAFFGIEDGYAHYSLQDNQNFNVPFKVHLRSFKGVSDSVEYVLHQQDDEETTQLKIPEYPFKNNSFEIHYAATFFQDDEVMYSTHLSGVDEVNEGWSTIGFRQYTKLKEGDYSFKVQAKNRYGVQSKPLVFKFKVLPPWHRHLYAKIAYLILLIALTIIVIKIFNRRVEVSRQKEELNQRARYKAKEEQLMNEALRADKELIKMRNDRLRSDMLFKEKELANSALSVIQKNEFLASIKERLKRIKSSKDLDEIVYKLGLVIKNIDKDIDSESHWEAFELHFEQVHAEFLKRLKEKHADLSLREQKLCAYIRMGMTSKEIAMMMNISFRAVENNRYRLRQKLDLMHGENLSRYISTL